MLSLHHPSDRTQPHATRHTRRHRSCSPTPDRNRHRGTASSRRAGPAPRLPPPVPHHLGAWVPHPGKAGPGGDRGPRGPTHPPRRGLPRRRRPRDPRSRPGSARARRGPGSHLNADCGRGQTPTACAARAAGATPGLNPAPAFPAPWPRPPGPASEASRRRSPDPAPGARTDPLFYDRKSEGGA